VVVQVTPRAYPEMVEVPLAADLAKMEEGRKLIQVGVHDRGTVFRPYVLPPRVPRERAQQVRSAFDRTLADPDFLADAKKSNLVIGTVAGDDLKRIILDLFKLESSVATRLREILQ
jgi:hypothetical protein